MNGVPAAVWPFLAGFALVLLVLHPVLLVLILAAELAFITVMAVAIAARLGVTFPTPWRST